MFCCSLHHQLVNGLEVRRAMLGRVFLWHLWLRREYLLLAARLCRKHTPTLLRQRRFGIQPLGRYASTSTVLSVPRFLALVCWFVSISINRSSSSSISIHSLTAAAAAAGGVAMV